MAYRFAAAVGLVGLVAGMPAPLPAAVTTVVVTTTVGAGAAPTQTVQQKWSAPQQPQQPQQPQVNSNPAPVAQSSPVVQPTASQSSSSPQSTSSSSPKSGSSAKYGGGICVDGTIGDTQSAAQSVAGSSSVKWWNNWSDKGHDLSNGAKFFPMLHQPGQKWSGQPSGEVALAYNEADLTNSNPSSLCQQFKTDYLQPAKAAGMKTTTPSVTSSDCTNDSSKGACWIASFLQSCTSDVDLINVHYYLGKDPTGFASSTNNPDFAYFKKYIDTLAAHGKPIIISELGLDPTVGSWTTQQVQTFLGAAVKYLETRPEVVGWAGYQVGNKPGNMMVGQNNAGILNAITGGS